MKTNSSIDMYKVRLVIKECRQKEGLDYFDTYSSITRITSIRDLEIYQMDVKTAFLNGDLNEKFT